MENANIWRRFVDEMPELGRPLVIIETDKADENEAGEFHSAHVSLAYADSIQVGFQQSIAIFRTDWLSRTSEQLSERSHAQLKETGFWTYQADLVRSSGLPDATTAKNIFMNGDRAYEGNLKGVMYEP